MNDIAKLQELYDMGFITKVEYDERKQKQTDVILAVEEELKRKWEPSQSDEPSKPKKPRLSAAPNYPNQGLTQTRITTYATTITTADNADPTPTDAEETPLRLTCKLKSNGSLPDYLCGGLNLVMVGDNPGLASAANNSWYAHQTNHFWPLLFESGLIKQKLGPKIDFKILEEGIGLTCLVAKPTSTTTEISSGEWNSGVPGLFQKLLKYKPKIICVNGAGIYKTISGTKNIGFGMQAPIRINAKFSIPCFVIPSTSARVTIYGEKLALLRRLKEWIHNQSR